MPDLSNDNEVAEARSPAAPGTPARGLAIEGVRRENLATVLRLVHHGGSVGRSRSELATITGLNRSTISYLVGELSARGLASEADPLRRTRVGRPSPIVTPTDVAVAMAVNPEIDAITVATVGLGGRVLNRLRRPVAEGISVDEAVEVAAEAIRILTADVRPDQRIVGVGAAVPGLVRTEDGMVRLAPHFGWVDVPFTRMLAEATGLPVRAENDATLGVRAESTFGAGRGVRDVVYLNGGASGIGGGIISGGVLMNGSAGYAGELGHTLVRSDGTRCHCGAIGCLETEVRRAPLLTLTGMDDAHADDLAVALASSTSAKVQDEIDRQLRYLGIALRNAINILNPGTIILGGFLSALHGAAAERLEAATQPLAASREGVTIAPAQLGADILLVGAAELAFADLLADPSTFG